MDYEGIIHVLTVVLLRAVVTAGFRKLAGPEVVSGSIADEGPCLALM